MKLTLHVNSLKRVAAGHAGERVDSEACSVLSCNGESFVRAGHHTARLHVFLGTQHPHELRQLGKRKDSC